MKLSPIIDRIKERCPLFEGRVGNAVEFKPERETVAMAVPSAYVVPLADEPGAMATQTGYYQDLTDRFAVIVLIDNKVRTASDQIYVVRASLLLALAGAEIDGERLIYGGYDILGMDRARLYVQYEFSEETAITDEETAYGEMIDSLPTFDDVKVGVDLIDPIADPNVSYPGPDGRNEGHDLWLMEKADVSQ